MNPTNQTVTQTVTGTIKQIYEIKTPAPGIIRRNFVFKPDQGGTMILTCFNNISILEPFKEKDKVTVFYIDKSTKEHQNIFANKIIPISNIESADPSSSIDEDLRLFNAINRYSKINGIEKTKSVINKIIVENKLEIPKINFKCNFIDKDKNNITLKVLEDLRTKFANRLSEVAVSVHQIDEFIYFFMTEKEYKVKSSVVIHLLNFMIGNVLPYDPQPLETLKGKIKEYINTNYGLLMEKNAFIKTSPL